MEGFAGKVALVTGASRGIGAAVGRRLARCGATVFLDDLTGAEQVAAEIERRGGHAVPLRGDVGDEADVKRVVDEVVRSAGGIDILINNAGVIRRGGFLAQSDEALDDVFRVNLWGTLWCSRAALPSMLERGGGAIVNVSSIAGKIGDITAAASYGSSKGAVNALTKSLAREFGPSGIRVNAVAPHAIETDMSSQWSDEKRNAVVAGIPLGRLGTPEEVAEAVVFLASESAGFITGVVLNVNGGFLMD